MKPVKFDQGKERVDLITPEFIMGIGAALGYGADKYSESIDEIPNYLKGQGFHYSKIYASLQRHLNKWYSGENIDEESGLHHLQLAAANLMFLYTYEKGSKGVDNRLTKDLK